MLGLLLTLSISQDPGADFFEAKIRPLFVERCVSCHGEEKQKGDLRLDLYGSILAGGESGAAITPGDAEESLLLLAVSYEDEFLQMPPRNQLTADEQDDLRAWVEMGAPGPATEAAGDISAGDFDLEAGLKHWAYQPVKESEPPAVSRFLSGSNWARRPLDSFIERRLRSEGLEPAPEAERGTWLRRVSYGVTGLPPTSAELAAFLDDRSPRAYERVVDELIASPHYGEKWARHWLDLVRYGETRGHEFDYLIPNAFEYRDYLTRAFNDDVPYDRFVIEHIAGDLVEEPRIHPTEGYDESVIGTGFWHLGDEVHSPVDIKGDESDRVSNQIEVFTRTFLAMSVSCARCHDHKFDPIPTEDFYALAGFLHSSSYRQVLFESLHQNTLVAEAIAELDAERGPDTRRSFAEALRPSLERVAERLRATRDVINHEPVDVDEKAPFPEGLEIIFEDFEGDSWGAWEVEGNAFGVDPPLLSDIPDYHKVKLKDWRGERFVCTHRSPAGEDSTNYDPVGLDARTGRLLSPEFTIEHDFLHFLVCGGDDAQKTAVRLLVEDEAVLSRAGSTDGVFRPASFNMSEWRGKQARVEVADEGGGSWGHIGVDHIVFSNRSDSGALARALRAEEQRAHFAAVQEVAEQHDVDPDALSAWTLAVAEAREDAKDPLHAWAKFCEGAPIERSLKPAAWSMPAETATVFSYEDASHSTAWIQDGNLFGPSPRALGSASFSADPAWPIDSFTQSAGAYVDPTWAEHEFGFGINGFSKSPSTATPGSLLNWNLSGRTLRTPTFLPQHGLVHYLVRGSGRCFAAIDSHRMIAGPLHDKSIKRFEAQRGWRWETHDLREYIGHKVHLEFTPVDGMSDFAIALIVEGPTQPSAPEEWSLGLEGTDAFPAEFVELLNQAVDSLITPEPAQGGAGRDAAALLDWIALHPELFPDVDVDALIRAVSPHIEERVALFDSIKTGSRSAPAMLDGSGINEHVFIRGNHTSLGEVALRRLPAALPGSEPIEAAGSGRLELARRLSTRENPLIARVMVNRIWHHLFGRGLVSSVDDFGKQGTPPSHPELLDYLAHRFVEEGWSMKKLTREIVLSSTYRQSITGDPEGIDRDPENILLGRSPVRRLEAEAIRDGALAVSGSLDKTLYGPSIPVHLDAFMEGRGRPSVSGPVDGESRRSLYISVSRNFLSPFFKVFDRPIPFTTQGRRSKSNVPAQSLAMMNDPLFDELAKRWAKRILRSSEEEGWSSKEDIIKALYLEAFARAPLPEETQQLLNFLGDRDDEEAWADICHVLFNVKEFIYLN